MCEYSAVGKICDCQPEGRGFNPRPGRGLNLGWPSFATPSVDRDVELSVNSPETLSHRTKTAQSLQGVSRVIPGIDGVVLGDKRESTSYGCINV